ncbi:hypothetical protein CDAR_74181 [Caerostris darwini]|uniref:Uncharacterized protein n=1 Tax=Caerostris darwini TaxID=1538125 RepID=A0AAV4QE82_9ARAC|nr:hypothetical protein CDAR_74181 [Caerostris darwini]
MRRHYSNASSFLEGLLEDKSEKDGRGYYRTLICHGLSGVTAGFLSRRLINSDRTKREHTAVGPFFGFLPMRGNQWGSYNRNNPTRFVLEAGIPTMGEEKISQSHKSLPKCIFPILNW